MKVDSREYKIVIDGEVLAEIVSGLGRLLEDIARVGRETGVVVRDEFASGEPKKRLIRFLDTRDDTLKANDLLLRQRFRPRDGRTEYTLKCRSADRYIAAAKNVDAAKRFKEKDKFEDDIGPPFVSRLSHSTTVEVGRKLAGDNFPKTLSEAGEIFPGLLEASHGGRACSPKTRLLPVRDPPVFEQLFTGPVLKTGKGEKIGPVAVILWSGGKKGRVLIAELSFRHEQLKKKRMGEIASAAKRFFEGLQRQPWARPEAIGKTEFMYRGR